MKVNKCALNKKETFHIVWISELGVAAQLVSVALWADSHKCDQKYCDR